MKRIAIPFLLGFFALRAATSSGESISPRYASAHITSEQWRVFLAEVKATPDVKCEKYVLNQYACNSAAERTIWVFTSFGHPAHPAVSRGVIFVSPVPGGTVLSIDRSGHYAGNRAAFDKWMHEFAILDQQQIAQLGRQNQN